MELQINSKKLGKTLTFSRPGPNYVYVDLNGEPGTLGNQICYGGYLMGDTIMASDSDFEKECRSWYRAYLRNMARDSAFKY